ncbi:MAG: thioredoxin family protein [Bacteroidales bacterium]|nr:thioredoxin family protein [Bacteroidales bacterium]
MQNTNKRFLRIINSSKPVMVDFYADWCKPCQKVQPILKAVKQEIGDVRIVRVNVDRNPMIARSYKIGKIPALIVFKSGEPIWMHEGIFCPEKLKSVLHNAIAE